MLVKKRVTPVLKRFCPNSGLCIRRYSLQTSNPISVFEEHSRCCVQNKGQPVGRPRDFECHCEETIPTALFHPAVGQFVDDCHKIDTVSPGSSELPYRNCTATKLRGSDVSLRRLFYQHPN
ncbi:hypothetical protein F5I97DRAFT_679989 [Phlebopus sp. FC_14]|nr:hypothetical protein F5I97DRAFT_679989 [Phlebopus sp. FC_14]